MKDSQENQVINSSGLRPLGRAVLVKPYEPAKKASLIELPTAVRDRMEMIDTRVVVIALGPACWPNELARAKPGDKVYISEFSGKRLKGTNDGVSYRVVNDNDIYLAIDEESQNGN